MRSLVVTGMATALMLAGCNTLRGTGKDIQALGETVTGAGHATSELVEGGPHENLRQRTVQQRGTSTEVYAYDYEQQQQQQQHYTSQEQQFTQLPRQQRTMRQDQSAQQSTQLQWRRIEETDMRQQAMQRQRLERATKLMGMDLVSTQGQPLGNLEKIVFDTQRGHVTYAIVSTHDDQRYVIPWEAIEYNPMQRETLTLFSGPQQLQQMNRQAYSKQIGHMEQSLDQMRGDSSMGQQARMGMSQAGTNELIGMTVNNREGESLGQIEDIVLDVSQGRAVFVLISLPEEEGRLSAVPFDTLQVEQRLVTRGTVPADAQQLEAVAFNENQHPFQDLQFARRVQDQFADRDAYWDVYAFPGGGPEEIDTANLKSINGEIVSVGTFRGESGEADGLRLRVRTNDGDLVTVHGGPRGYALQQGVMFRPGDKVSVRGAESEVEGRQVIVATEISRGQTLRLRNDEGQPNWISGGSQQGQTRQQSREQRQQPRQEQPERDQADDAETPRNNGFFR